MKKRIGFFISLILHISAVVAIVVAFLPMAKWYFENPILPSSTLNSQARPLWGVDFYYTATLVNLLKDNFVFPHLGWGYAWFSGWPFLSNYPFLHYYFIAPLTAFFPLLSAIKLWMVISLLFYIVGCYAVFYRLSHNFAVSLVLSVAAIYSVGVYGTLMWGGSLSSHATQAFFPWTLFFVISYLKSRRKAYLLLAGVLAGLAILGHPQVVIAYIYPSASILFLFSFVEMKFFNRVKALIVFLFLSFIIGFPLLYSSMGGALKSFFVTDVNKIALSTVKIPGGDALAIEAFHKAQPLRMYTDTNTTIFILLIISFALFVLSLVFKHRKNRFFAIAPFVVLAILSAVYVWVFAYGISIYHGGWYRLFWAVPLWVGLLAASLWGVWQESILGLLKKKYVFFAFHAIIIVIILIWGIFSIQYFSSGIREKIVLRSTPSSAFPDILNLHTKVEEFDQLKKTMIPSWIDGDNTQYRLYTGDQTINIWWNALYKMPLSRGYFDPPVPSVQNRGYFFLVDASLSQDTATGKDQLVGSFKYPEAAALNNTLFLVDWYGIKYFQTAPSMASFSPLPASFDNSTYIKREETMDFNKEKYNTGNMWLQYYEVKDEYTSPILSGTNAPTLGIIATDTGYETVVRALADMNSSSKQVIPIKLGQYIDKLKTTDLSAMDALIVYDYNYSNKGNAYRLLSDYLKKGKKIFIDTGVEVKEATSTELPEIFPMNRSERKPLGKTWDFEVGNSELVKDIDFSIFDAPIFNDQAWSITYPLDSADIREGSTILLKNKGKVVMIGYDVGGSQVIWSGINLPYHTIRSHNVEEVRFFKKVIEELLEGNPTTRSGQAYETQFINPQKRQITVAEAKGILFKEQAYPGWRAKVTSDTASRAIKIFKAGPAYPGFMYIRLPDDFSGKRSTTVFSYSGSFTSWAVTIISIVLFVVVIEEALFNGIILGRLRRQVLKKLHLHVKTWWSKEDE